MRHGQRARSGLKAARAPRRERHPRAARKCVFRVKEIEGERGKSARFLKKGGTTNAIRPLSAGQIRDFLFAGAPKHHAVLALAPLSVNPAFQRQGVGTALIRAAHSTAAALGYGWSVVLGSETYYPRLGYAPAAQFGIAAPRIPAENLMAVRLREDAAPLHGTLVYPAAFGI